MLRGRRWLYWIFAAVIALGVAAMVMFCRRSKEPTVSSGSLETYRDFVSQHVKSRTVRVWLSDGYQRGASKNIFLVVRLNICPSRNARAPRSTCRSATTI